MDIYNYAHRLKLLEERIKLKVKNKKDREIFEKFKNECIARGNSISRVIRYLEDLLVIYDIVRNKIELEKSLDSLNIDDVKRIVAEIEQSDYAETTKYCFKVTLKRFFKIIRNVENGNPPEVSWFRLTEKFKNKKLPEDLLTEEDIIKLVKSADTPRDKALVFVLYESGCRISEILTLKIKNIKFDDYGAVLVVDGKTGQRRIRIVSSAPYIKEWLNNYQDSDNPDALLFPLRYDQIRYILGKLKKKCNIKKKVNPHNFRHSRATFLANYLTESQMKQYFGWTQSSEMASVYVHLSGRDIDNSLLKLYGIEVKSNDVKTAIKPKICFRCQEVNPPTNEFCKKCGNTLDIEKDIERIREDTKRELVDNIMNELIKDSEFCEMLRKKIREIKKKLKT
ncbi:MAG: site-specific integrase [Candidatus Aenigmatarchaeota archaeon]